MKQNELVNEIINLTPHDIVVYLDNGDTVVYPSKGVLRISENREYLCSTIEGVKIFKKYFGTSSDLPIRKVNTMYIVSVPVAQAHPERNDFIISDDIVRDNETGKIIGCKSFATLVK